MKEFDRDEFDESVKSIRDTVKQIDEDLSRTLNFTHLMVCAVFIVVGVLGGFVWLVG